MKLPKLTEALLTLSACNGGINRDRPEEQVAREIDLFLKQYTEEYDLPAIEEWLGTLTPAEIETMVDGEETEAREITDRGPPKVEDLITKYFEEVC